MSPPAARVIHFNRGQQSELLLLAVMAILVTVLFAVTPMDVAAARLFYESASPDHWPLAMQSPWVLLYRSAPWITASLVLAGLSALAVGFLKARTVLIRHAVFVLLCVVLGPGLLVNAVFKDHWDRPRPRDLIEFGGTAHYTPAPLRGEGGASFPCGHCSVGFLYGVGWWIWKRQRPRLAVASLAVGVSVGVGLGLGRMAAGGHFLSDVAWSALIALGLAHGLYYYVLRIPERDARDRVEVGAAVPDEVATSATSEGVPRPGTRPSTRSGTRHGKWQIAVAFLAALGGLAVLVAIFATPHGIPLATDITLASLPTPPRVFEVVAAKANIDITLVDTPATVVGMTGELHGFGLPTSRLAARTAFIARPEPTLRYEIEQSGWFTDLDGVLSIRLPVGELSRVVVRVDRGNIKVTDLTRAGVMSRGVPRLDLETSVGHVQRISGSFVR